MIKHILVPLDGTSFSEAALPATKTLAKLFSAKVTLLHLVEQNPTTIVHGESHLTNPAEAEQYLAPLKTQMVASGISCESHVHTEAVNHVAGGIVAHAKELHPDLIIMSTHGPLNLERLLRGTLAQQTVALGQTSLLLIPSSSDSASESFDLRQILVPLDGNPSHEGGFDLACSLAAHSKAKLQLLTVIPGPFTLAGRRAALSRFLPGSTWVIQSEAEHLLSDYLERLLKRIDTINLQGSAEISHGKIAKTIIDCAQSRAVDLIVLTTHGKSGTRAFWANSVAAKVQLRSNVPLLLYPV
jgi:nucleotide-binding universal stress UspA family protein